MTFDYKNSTIEELADFVEISPAQRITSMLIYHRDRGNESLVKKIVDARALAKKRKMIKMLETM
jgi:hypothetical protein